MVSSAAIVAIAMALSPLSVMAQESEPLREPEPELDAARSAPPTLRPAVALKAARPWSFTATVGPVALGAAMAFKFDDAMNPLLLGLTLVTTLAVHAAGNLMKCATNGCTPAHSSRTPPATNLHLTYWLSCGARAARWSTSRKA